MTIERIHEALGYLAIGVAVAGVVWAAALALARRPAPAVFERFQAAVVSTVIVGAASGALLVAVGETPRDGLHLLYAGVAIVCIPLARSFGRRDDSRRGAMLLLVAFIVLAAVLGRLASTG